jgi:CheY-like chemotaxis protein
MRILVVDDVRDVREMTGMLLQILGHEVFAACNGLQALQMASRQAADVILMDLSMPIMDGLTATRHLRESSDTCHIPIIAISALMVDTARENAIAAGCNECHPKPVDLETLGAIMARYESRV